MPVQTGSDDKGCYARWGSKGFKYRYPCGNEEARKEAKSKANQQGLAIGEYSKQKNPDEKPVYDKLKEFFSLSKK